MRAQCHNELCALCESAVLILLLAVLGVTMTPRVIVKKAGTSMLHSA